MLKATDYDNQIVMTKNCCVCERDGASYKCPTCWKPYCSVTCCKEHKIQVCELPKKPEVSESVIEEKYKFPTENTVPIEKLHQLRYSDELKECLKNPHVRDIMKSILNSHNPTAEIALAMREPIFVEMADACLKVVELKDEDELGDEDKLENQDKVIDFVKEIC